MLPDTQCQRGLVGRLAFWGRDFAAAKREVIDVLLRLRVEDARAVVFLDVPVVVEEDVVEHLLDNMVCQEEMRDEQCLVCEFLLSASTNNPAPP